MATLYGAVVLPGGIVLEEPRSNLEDAPEGRRNNVLPAPTPTYVNLTRTPKTFTMTYPHHTIEGAVSLLCSDNTIAGPSSGFQERLARVHMGDASVVGTGSQLRRSQKNEHPARVTDN